MTKNYRPFDMLRVIIINREQHVAPDVMKMLDEAEQLERQKTFKMRRTSTAKSL